MHKLLTAAQIKTNYMSWLLQIHNNSADCENIFWDKLWISAPGRF